MISHNIYNLNWSKHDFNTYIDHQSSTYDEKYSINQYKLCLTATIDLLLPIVLLLYMRIIYCVTIISYH